MELLRSRYSLYNTSDAASWQSLGDTHEAWAYHCVSPRPTLGPKPGEVGPMRWLNTFLESPPIQARLMPW